jgi:GH24 family phage-related lysozyme (muramidase)
MANMQITGSVGLGATNNPRDIKAVQSALNQLLKLIPPTRKLMEDGKLGSRLENSKTVAAVKLFQQKVVGMHRPDGKIDVNGKSHRKLNEKLNLVSHAVARPISVTLKNRLKVKLEQYEGRVEHMYLDTEGFVTVGVGNLLTSTEEAKKLAFVVRDTGIAATVQQKADEFIKIKARPFGKDQQASKFRPFTILKLSDCVINTMVDKHISSFEGELKRIYGTAEFNGYPDKVQLALFDMIFNLGMTKLKNNFPNFNKHIKAADFKKAALECSRTKIADERNAYVRNLLSSVQ